VISRAVSAANYKHDERYIAKQTNRQTPSPVVSSNHYQSAAATHDRDLEEFKEDGIVGNSSNNNLVSVLRPGSDENVNVHDLTVQGSTEQRLLRALLRDYDVDARGVDDVNKTVIVVMEFLLLRIQGLVSERVFNVQSCDILKIWT